MTIGDTSTLPARLLFKIFPTKKPLQLSKVFEMRAMAAQQQKSLAVTLSESVSTGKKLRNKYLSKLLAETELGAWTLDAATLNFLERQIQQKKPQTILEFGAGISTICFARFMLEQQKKPQHPCVYSIEQNQWQVEKSKEFLIKLGMENLVSILHAPLKKQVIEGRETECYDLTPSKLNEFLGESRPDFVLIDGPSGFENVRFGTIPLTKDHLQNKAVFFLDDAFRDEELNVAKEWSEISYLSIKGIYKIGKGLLRGEFHPKF